MMDTLTNSRLGDKIFMYSKVDENSEGHAILRQQKEQINQKVVVTKTE